MGTNRLSTMDLASRSSLTFYNSLKGEKVKRGKAVETVAYTGLKKGDKSKIEGGE